jgi:hypothetical protein
MKRLRIDAFEILKREYPSARIVRIGLPSPERPTRGLAAKEIV